MVIINDIRIERLFKRIDELIDGDCEDVVREVRSNASIRKQCQRLFPTVGSKSSTTLALEAFGFTFNKYIPTEKDLISCLNIDKNFLVVVVKWRYNELLAQCNLSEEELDVLLRPVMKELKLDAISEYVRQTSPELISYKNIRRDHQHIRVYIEDYLGGIDNFREMFGIDVRLALHDNPSFHALVNAGYELEKLIEKYVLPEANTQVTIGNCRPDFINDNAWIDAKLSKGTALYHSDDTIEKYLKHTDNLMIIYALEDGADTSKVEKDTSVEFKHISEFYEDMSAEAISEIEEFIRRASNIKGISF